MRAKITNQNASAYSATSEWSSSICMPASSRGADIVPSKNASSVPSPLLVARGIHTIETASKTKPIHFIEVSFL